MSKDVGGWRKGNYCSYSLEQTDAGVRAADSIHVLAAAVKQHVGITLHVLHVIKSGECC